jgi:hypothetical protein
MSKADSFADLRKKVIKKITAIPLTCRGGLYGWDVKDPTLSRQSLIDGGKVVSPTHRPHFTPQKHYFLNVSGTHSCYKLSKPQGLVWAEGLCEFKISPHWVSNPRPSGSHPNALTTKLPRAPICWPTRKGTQPDEQVSSSCRYRT